MGYNSTDLLFTVAVAARKERETGKPYYVVWSAADDEYLTTDRMPLFGEWYTSEGIRHGA